MGKEEFTVRVTKKGEVLLEVEGLPARRIKDLIKHFEETLGPVRLVDADGNDASGRVALDDALARQEEEEGEEHDRQRLRERE